MNIAHSQHWLQSNFFFLKMDDDDLKDVYVLFHPTTSSSLSQMIFLLE